MLAREVVEALAVRRSSRVSNLRFVVASAGSWVGEESSAISAVPKRILAGSDWRLDMGDWGV